MKTDVPFFTAVWQIGNAITGDFGVDLSFIRNARYTIIRVCPSTFDAVNLEIDELKVAEELPSISLGRRSIKVNPNSGNFVLVMPRSPKYIGMQTNAAVYVGADYTDSPATIVVEVYE